VGGGFGFFEFAVVGFFGGFEDLGGGADSVADGAGSRVFDDFDEAGDGDGAVLFGEGFGAEIGHGVGALNAGLNDVGVEPAVEGVEVEAVFLGELDVVAGPVEVVGEEAVVGGGILETVGERGEGDGFGEEPMGGGLRMGDVGCRSRKTEFQRGGRRGRGEGKGRGGWNGGLVVGVVGGQETYPPAPFLGKGEVVEGFGGGVGEHGWVLSGV
jgi:hypothetical protein